MKNLITRNLARLKCLLHSSKQLASQQLVTQSTSISEHLRRLPQLAVAVAAYIAMALFPASVFSATPDLATKPLSAASSVVKPNLMFVLDTSRSMEKDRANDVLNDGGQCKDGLKNNWGTKVDMIIRGDTVASASPYIQAATKPNTRLTVKLEGSASYGVGARLYLTVPGNPTFSGVYIVQKRNIVPATGGGCNGWVDRPGYTRPVECYGAHGAWAGNPFSDPPVPSSPACSCLGPTPANVPDTSNHRWLGGGTDASCQWLDRVDQAPYRECNSWDPTVPETGDNTFEIDVADTGTYGIFSADQIRDASVRNEWDNSTCAAGEPPLSAAKAQSLFYDPSVRYEPPPSPQKVGLGLKYPNNLLPSMTAAYTTAWAAVRTDGLLLNAAGGQISGTANMFRHDEMVWCDTPNRPSRKISADLTSGTYGSDQEWHEDSNRCKRNTLTSNLVAKAPNYPYVYPARTDGGTNTPARTLTVSQNLPHQIGQTPLSTANPILNNRYMFGETYSYAAPYYYNIIPIEYCRSSRLDDCQLAGPSSGPTAAVYNVPAYVRFCKQGASAPDQFSTASDTSYSPGAAQCQGIYTGNSASDFRIARYGLFQRVDVVPASAPFVKAATRTDCSTATCSYAEEMTNYANWYAYYRTRMQLMKSAVGRTFNELDKPSTPLHDESEDYRVGFITVEGYNTIGNYLPIKDFVAGVNAQKELFFKNIYSRTPAGGTSLRDVLGTVGRIFAGKKPISGFTGVDDDPMQYSCQQNFTLLTTDGNWNGAPGVKVDGSAIGNQDSIALANFPQREGAVPVSETLADVSRYYFKTDIRHGVNFGNCIGQLGLDVCDDGNMDADKAKQRMTTFTLGLGVDGHLSYTSDYETPSGDFIQIKSGFLRWPQPGPDNNDSYLSPLERATIDDLWHAAVNGAEDGKSKYFNAKNPQDVIDGVRSALATLGDITGTASTTGLSNIIPVSGDNYAFSARYATGRWTGNLFARTINSDATLSEGALWCVENEPNVTPTCSPSSATGLYTKVASGSDTRTIYTHNGSSLVPFKYGSLSATQQNYFNAGHLSPRLSQWAGYNAYQVAEAANGHSLVDYLRGQFGYDMRTANNLNIPPATTGDNRLYRERATVLGDIVDSDPIFVGKAKYEYLEHSYADTFVTATETRARTVFIGANDGMLHAFNADTGEERWAFVPTTVIPNLWQLADQNYRNQHTNYVNADITVADIYVGGGWKTILVSGLGQGGQGYFALDITNPAAPSFLWEVNPTTGLEIGYSYGKPVVTKRQSDGKWVVLLTSGYNNTSDGGKGRLFVLDAYSGNDLSSGGISTDVGSATTPSGLAQVSAFVANPMKNNEAQFVYGGDLLGNLWRFDINDNTVVRLTTLSGGGTPQPIMVAPTLTEVDGKRVLFVGTGKYIEPDDLSTSNYKTQSLYAIKDDNIATPIGYAALTSQMVEKTIAGSSGTRSDTSPEENQTVDWSTQLGWYVHLPSSAATGERQNVRATLVSGVLFVPTIIPPTGVCDTNGTGWRNVFNFRTGGALDPGTSTVVSTQSASPMAGLYFVFTSTDGDIDDSVAVGADFTTGTLNNDASGSGTLGSNGAFSGSRAVWRELVQ